MDSRSGYPAGRLLPIQRLKHAYIRIRPYSVQRYGVLRPYSDTFIVPTGDTACLDSVLFYEKETGFRYVSRPGICVSCVPTGSEGELGVGERKSKVQEPFILIGRTLVPQTYVEVFSSDGRTVYRGKGSTLLKPGVYFVRSRDKITRVMVR